MALRRATVVLLAALTTASLVGGVASQLDRRRGSPHVRGIAVTAKPGGINGLTSLGGL